MVYICVFCMCILYVNICICVFVWWTVQYVYGSMNMTVSELYAWCRDRGMDEFRLVDGWGLGVSWDDITTDEKKKWIVIGK